MTRQTSIDVFNRIRENGMLSDRRWEVYSSLFRHGPATASELATVVTWMRKNDLSSRLTELVSMGVAMEVRERKCSVTEQTVIEFDVTDQFPTKFRRPASKLEQARSQIRELRNVLGELLEEIDSGLVEDSTYERARHAVDTCKV